MKIILLSFGLSILPQAQAADKKAAPPTPTPVVTAKPSAASGGSSDFKKACEAILKKDKKVKDASARCGCVARNLEVRLKPAEIQLLAQSYAGSEEAEAKLDKPENQSLQDFELEVSQNCMTNSKWQATPEKEEKNE